MKHCLFTCLVVLWFFAANGQSPNLIFRNINRSSGLPVDQVNCVAEDSTGFMWIGTSEGLFKYDGFIYKQVNGTSASQKDILNSQIASLYVTKDGLIWATISYGGIAIFRSSGELVTLLNSANNTSFLSDRAHRIVQDQTGAVWCSTDAGLYELKIDKDDRIRILRHVDLKKLGHNTNVIGDFIIDRDANIWIGSFTGLVIYNKNTNELYHRFNNPAQLSLLNGGFAARSLFYDEQKQMIWYSNWEPSLKVYNVKTKSSDILYSVKPFERPDYSWMVNYFLKDKHGRLWVATNKGVFLALENLSGIQQQFSHEPEMHTSIADNAVRHINEDKEGNFWFATDNGISVANPYGRRFSNLSLNVLKTHSFADKYVSAIIIIDSNSLLVCTHGADGIYETDHQFNIKKHYSFDSNDYDWVWEFFEDKPNGAVYISTQKGMLQYNSVSHTLKKLTEPPFDKFYPVTAFITGKSGTIWMSRYSNEFIQYDVMTKKYTTHKLEEYGITPQQMKLAKDAENNLWILGNATGLYQVDTDRKRVIQKLEPQKNDINSLRQSEVILFKDIGNYLLLGYDQKGFSLYNKKTGAFTHYNKSNGLAGNRVNDAWIQSDGNVWIATSNGINSLNIKTLKLAAYNYDDGIISNNVFFITDLPAGMLVAGTAKGVVLFDPKQVKQQAALPAPFVTDVSVYGRQLNADSVFETGRPLHISHQENYFSLNYICLQYSHQQQVEYAYKLDGFDKDWIEAGTRRFTSYANLQGGNYSFKLRARLPGGQWIEAKSALGLHVATIFYKRWWFIPLCALLLIGLLYGVFRYRLKQFIKLEKMRASISSDLHDEVGATLSSISIFSEMAKQNLPQHSKADAYLQRIGERSRDSIEKMSDIIWSINPAHDSLEEMLIRMKTFVNENVEGKDITVHWQQSESIAGLKLGMLQRKNFYLLFKEAIINALKYADAHNIYVQLSTTNKIVSLKITDDGKGFDFSKIKQGNGINNIRNRALQLSGVAKIESSPGKGTTVYVEFKI